MIPLSAESLISRSVTGDLLTSAQDQTGSPLTGVTINAADIPIDNTEYFKGKDDNLIDWLRDYSTGDIPHVFVSSVVWDLPAGAGRARQLHGVLGAVANDWTVASLITMQS